ncbi:hypothetical protein ACFWP2_19630 [Kitasatospora sp. NPDC058444]|uniref:hypothetical protein n=1 Tax=Kitasatospora sp. NPDC058444 TaxID=3346504 RepID=UPI003657919B
MMDPVTLLLLGTAPAALKVADALARSLLLRALADLARAQAQARAARPAAAARASEAADETSGGAR